MNTPLARSCGFISLGLILLLIIGLAVIGGGGWYASKQSVGSEQMPTTSPVSQGPEMPSMAKSTQHPANFPAPSSVVLEFYSGVIGQLATTSDAWHWDQSNLVTQRFIKRIQEAPNTGFIPVVCAQDGPLKYTATELNQTPATSEVQVTGIYSGDEESHFQIDLIKEPEGWKIDDIHCQSPNHDW